MCRQPVCMLLGPVCFGLPPRDFSILQQQIEMCNIGIRTLPLAIVKYAKHTISEDTLQDDGQTSKYKTTLNVHIIQFSTTVS